jgi:hypothetical protein
MPAVQIAGTNASAVVAWSWPARPVRRDPQVPDGVAADGHRLANPHAVPTAAIPRDSVACEGGRDLSTRCNA